jgi:Cd2+/Zn2+-exporting ATPase
MSVEGMDCGACALKIENALKRLPGVADINVNYGAETLDLKHDADRSSRQAIEDKIRSLGYTPRSLATEQVNSTHSTERADRPWWQTRKGQLVLVSAVLLAAAATVAWVAPDLSFYAYL